MERWRTVAAKLFTVGDYLHAEAAERNSFLASEGVTGPMASPRNLKPGERVMFAIHPQASYDFTGRLISAGVTSGEVSGAVGGTNNSKPAPTVAAGGARPLPATGGRLTLFEPMLLATAALLLTRTVRRRR